MDLDKKKKTKKDILDELDARQLAGLNESLEQYKSGKTFSHDEIKKEIQQRLRRK